MIDFGEWEAIGEIDEVYAMSPDVTAVIEQYARLKDPRQAWTSLTIMAGSPPILHMYSRTSRETFVLPTIQDGAA